MKDAIILMIIVVAVAIVASMAGRQDALNHINEAHEYTYCNKVCHEWQK